MRYFAFIFLISCTYKATVRYVIDGDTFMTSNNERIRIAEIDAPEHNQDYGLEATEFTKKYLLGKTVTLKNVDTDKYGRKVCEVYVDSIWFNDLIVKSGLAWAPARYSSLKLQMDELAARKAKIGLWASNRQITPYIFRKQHRK